MLGLVAMLLAADPAPIVELAVSPIQSFACARYGTGEVWCAGEGQFGQLGVGLDMLDDPRFGEGKLLAPFIEVSRVREAKAVGAGRYTGCALAQGGVWCWGFGGGGELGSGEFRTDGHPTLIADTADAIALGVGDAHGCLIAKDGKVFCWGHNENGQLGDGTTEKRASPVEVRGVAGAKALALGDRISCALTAKNAVWCWGLGTGPKAPAPVPGLGKVEGLVAVKGAVCARTGKTTKCVGGGAMPEPDCAVGADHRAHCAKGVKIKAVVERL